MCKFLLKGVTGPFEQRYEFTELLPRYPLVEKDRTFHSLRRADATLTSLAVTPHTHPVLLLREGSTLRTPRLCGPRSPQLGAAVWEREQGSQ